MWVFMAMNQRIEMIYLIRDDPTVNRFDFDIPSGFAVQREEKRVILYRYDEDQYEFSHLEDDKSDYECYYDSDDDDDDSSDCEFYNDSDDDDDDDDMNNNNSNNNNNNNESNSNKRYKKSDDDDCDP